MRHAHLGLEESLSPYERDCLLFPRHIIRAIFKESTQRYPGEGIVEVRQRFEDSVLLYKVDGTHDAGGAV